MRDTRSEEEIKKIAFRLLSHRDYSEAELKAKLEDKGFHTTPVKEVLTDLKKMGYINDRSYCERLAKHLAAERLMGDRRIEATLLGKGLPSNMVKETLSRIREELPEEEALKRYLERAGTKRVTAGKLIYRGFPPGLVYEVLHGRSNDEVR